MASPYEFKTYREFIAAELESPRFGYGARSRLADYLGVQKSFISLVLKGDGDFSLDHGFKIAAFFELDGEDRDTFMLMMNRDRAGTSDLRGYYQAELDRLKNDRERLKAQIKADSDLTEANYSEYTSSWQPSAIHMVIRNPALRTADAVAEYLRIERPSALKALKLLERIGFAKLKNGKYEPIDLARFHTSKDSPGLRAHHVNWRIMAAQSLDASHPKDIHYSLQVSIDATTFDKMRKLVLDSVKGMEPLIAKADDREVYALNLDLFKVGG